MNQVFVPEILPTTTTTELANQIIDSIGAGCGAFCLGRYVASWDAAESGYVVTDEVGVVRGVVCSSLQILTVPRVVRGWYREDWSLV